MNPAFQVPGLKPGKYRIGDRVRMKTVYKGVVGEIVEDRGNLGRGGKRVYAIKMRLDDWNEVTLEYTDDSFELFEAAKRDLPSNSDHK